MASRQARLEHAAHQRLCCNGALDPQFTPLRTMTAHGLQQEHDKSLKRGDGSLTLVRLSSSEPAAIARRMEEHRDEPKPVSPCRTAQWWLSVLVLACLTL